VLFYTKEFHKTVTSMQIKKKIFQPPVRLKDRNP
jgi:hypothetical protein